jgi:hypothetical protein
VGDFGGNRTSEGGGGCGWIGSGVESGIGDWGLRITVICFSKVIDIDEEMLYIVSLELFSRARSDYSKRIQVFRVFADQ